MEVQRGVRLRGADGLTIAADLFGPASAQPVIFMHGGGQSRSAWRGAARRVAAAGFRGVSIDLRGHGDSNWAPDGNYAFDRYIADLEEAIGALGSPAILVGASLGGHVALVAASQRPDKIAALALADVTPWVDENMADGMREEMRSSAVGFDTVEAAAAMVDRLRGTGPHPNPQGIRRFLREGEHGRFYWRWDPRFVEDRFVRHGGENGLFARAARALTVPTLLMHAEFSTVVSPDQVVTFRKEVPALKVEQIEGVGHMVTGDDNDVYADTLIRFFRSIPGLSGRGAAVDV